MDADLIVTGGRPFAVVDRNATAVVVRAGRIAWIGSDREALARWRGPGTEIVEAGGGTIMPGFDDAHTHLLSGARAMREVNLFQLTTVEAIQAAIRAYAATHQETAWVFGRGWLYVPFSGGLPTRQQLDAVVADRPAYMECYDGHTGWLNSVGLRAAGIEATTPDPPNGLIVRDRDGEPTGALKEGAMRLVSAVLPQPEVGADLVALRRAVAAHRAAGITAVQDAWVTPETLAILRQLDGVDQPGLRIRAALPMTPDVDLATWRRQLDDFDALAGPLRGGEWLSAGILKTFADGVIESRTAAMLAPYEEDTTTGAPEWTPDALDAHVTAADRRGWQVEIHAIGDRGVRMALDAFEAARAANGAWRGRPNGATGGPRPDGPRHRVEHIETLDSADIGRFATLDVVASMQPYHADPSPNQISLWAGNIGPERASRAWAWRSLLHAGATVALGSDWPVVPFDPWRAVNAAVNRQTIDGQPPGGWLPTERLTLREALTAYTHGSAYAAHADHRRGRLEPGLDADLIVLDRDLLREGASAIIGTTARLTVLGGRIVHGREDAQ